MEDNGLLFVHSPDMANTMHNNGREHKLSGSNLRVIPDIHGDSGKDNSNPIVNWFHSLNKKMAQIKLGWLILAHIVSTGVWGYALFVEWGTIQGYILGGLGIIIAVIQAGRITIKGLKELYEFKKQLKDYNKPDSKHPPKHIKHG